MRGAPRESRFLATETPPTHSGTSKRDRGGAGAPCVKKKKKKKAPLFTHENASSRWVCNPPQVGDLPATDGRVRSEASDRNPPWPRSASSAGSVRVSARRCALGKDFTRPLFA